MGNISEFIKAIGDCRIMVEKIRKYQSESEGKETAWFLSEITSCDSIQRDENGAEFITLTDFGNIIHDSKFYGYFDTAMINGLYAIYEAMSINGMQSYESKVKPLLPIVERRTSYDMYDYFFNAFMQNVRSSRPNDTIVVDGYFNSRVRFYRFNEMYNHFKKYKCMENPFDMVTTLKISKGLNDITIKTSDHDINSQSFDTTEPSCDEEEEIPREESCKKKQKVLKTDKPCKIYFLVEYPNYIYLEFLPYGQGIKLAKAAFTPFLSSSNDEDEDDDYDYTEVKKNTRLFFSKLKDEALRWEIQTLQ